MLPGVALAWLPSLLDGGTALALSLPPSHFSARACPHMDPSLLPAARAPGLPENITAASARQQLALGDIYRQGSISSVVRAMVL